MAVYPESITHAQLRLACGALGIPPASVVRLVTDIHDGVTVTVQVRDKDGRSCHQGNDVLTTEIRIPIAPEVSPDAPA